LVSDPLTFQFTIEPGVTTGPDVLDYIASSGICADMDPEGALFLVDICSGMGAAADAGIGLYPNPAVGGFFLLPVADGPALLELIDVSGRVAHSQRIACARARASWVEAAAAPGSYVVRLTTPSGRWERRLALQR
ncbi:MAG: T9SS type A sorting domain-containing protein, partial [Flavobacteriales bacterium]